MNTNTAQQGLRQMTITDGVNKAVWLAEKRTAFVVRPAPYTKPQSNEIVVKNKAVAINPIDWILQSMGDIIFNWLKYPFILGSDVAGEVVEIGSSVTRFKIGDRVLGHAVGSDKQRNSSAEGAFQDYTIILQNMAAPIPAAMDFEHAVVLPLGVSTAACGLFEKDQLGLQYPSLQAQPTGKTILIWGGSTSVGSNAIQLAVAAGYEVITTASPKNFDYVKKLGASKAFDYKSKTVCHDIIKAFQGKDCAGAIAIMGGSAQACLEIMIACKGVKKIAMASPPVTFEDAPQPRTFAWLLPKIFQLVILNISLMTKAQLNGVRTSFIFGSSLMANEVSKIIYEDFLPAALANGSFVAAPEPLIFGHGLECIPDALVAQKKGLSAQKLVVTL